MGKDGLKSIVGLAHTRQMLSLFHSRQMWSVRPGVYGSCNVGSFVSDWLSSFFTFSFLQMSVDQPLWIPILF